MPQSSVEKVTQISCLTSLTFCNGSSSNTRGQATTQEHIKSARKNAKFFFAALLLCVKVFAFSEIVLLKS